MDAAVFRSVLIFAYLTCFIITMLCLPDTITALVQLLDYTLLWYANPFVEFCKGSYGPGKDCR